MRLWVDDMKDPLVADLFGLAQFDDGGEPWTWVKDSEAALPLLLSGDVTELALDNDLGYTSKFDGRDIASALLDHVLDNPGFTPPAHLTCISYNPVAETAIRQTFGDIRRVITERSQ